MPVNRRADQATSDAMPGGQLRTMAGAATGSKMMTVGDLTLQPGVDTVYHIHPNTEESIFVVEGEVEMRLDGHKFRAKAGDCMVARRGLGHGIANAGDGLARFVVMYPSASPEREITEEPEWKSGAPDQGVFFRDRVESFEFTPGVSRYDMVGDFLGSESSYFSELTLQPGSTTQNHYHPAHEESMFCLSGTIDAVYEDDNNLQLNEGDLFLCEPGLRHGVYNDGDEVAVLLALHPVLNPVPRVDVD